MATATLGLSLSVLRFNFLTLEKYHEIETRKNWRCPVDVIFVSCCFCIDQLLRIAGVLLENDLLHVVVKR